MKPIREILAALIGAALIVATAGLLSAAPATAAAAAAPATTAAAESTSIQAYDETRTWVNQVSDLYQCADFDCNTGRAYPGDVLYSHCYKPDPAGGNFNWDLIRNATNGHSGFIPSPYLGNDGSYQPCATAGVGSGPDAPVTLYQCPDFQCNQGQIRAGDSVAAICSTWAGGNHWVFAYNRTNGHEGFALHNSIDPVTVIPVCS